MILINNNFDYWTLAVIVVFGWIRPGLYTRLYIILNDREKRKKEHRNLIECLMLLKLSLILHTLQTQWNNKKKKKIEKKYEKATKNANEIFSFCAHSDL